MNRRILISENERSRILGLHENRRMKEWGLINEQIKYIKNKTTNVATMFNGPIIPADSVEISQLEFQNLTKTGGAGTTVSGATAVAPAPFIPNGYDSVEACKTAYKTTYLSGVSMKVFGQNYTVIQKKWIESKCNGKTPCDKSGAANTNLAMAICEGTFNMSGPVVPAPVVPAPVVPPPIPMKTLNPTSVSSTANQLDTGTTPNAATTPATVTPATVTPATVTPPPLQGVVDTTNLASRSDLRQQYRQGKRDVRELKKELNQNQNTLQRLGAKMTPEQKKQYETKIAQLQIQINQSAS
jgi:hypothetical protein